MRAIVADPENNSLHWREVDDPTLGPNEVLIQVHYSAVNRADLLQRAGKYPAPLGASEILGLEAAGVVQGLGSGVQNVKVGERVCCLLSGGAYAELVAVPATHLIRVPESFSLERAAGLPEAALTAFKNISESGLKKNERLLVHAAASGVGCMVVQWARELGAEVFATAGTDEKCTFVQELGAKQCFNYKSCDFALLLGEGSIDVVIDMVGASHFNKNLSVLKSKGRMVLLSLISGTKVECSLAPILRKNLTLIGSTLRDQSSQAKTQLTADFCERMLPKILDGKIKTIVDSVFPIEEAEKAHARVADNGNIGKVILKVV